jgi:hypothetical protein
MLATVALYLAPALAVLCLTVLLLINRRKTKRLERLVDTMQAATASAQDSINRRQALDAGLEALHERHRKENIDAQTPHSGRNDFDNNWLSGDGAAPADPDAAPAHAGPSGAAGD